MENTLHLLLFPGLVFTVVLTLFVTWLDRKVTARVQWRVGPPLLQPVYDVAKLLGKETVVPGQAPAWLFLGAPVMALGAALVFSLTLWAANMNLEAMVTGDLIVVLYLAMIPTIAIMLGGLVSGSPYSVLGASREIKLLIGDELIMVMALLVAVVKAGGTLRLDGILSHQQTAGAIVASPSGALALILAILALQAKSALIPFDASEAETEIMGGTLAAYSGPPLALFKLSQWIMRTMMPLLLVHCFWGGVRLEGWHILASLGKLAVFWVIMILMRNTNPRVRVDQALRFFVCTGGALGFVALILAWVGY